MATMGLNRYIEFSDEYPKVFEMLSKAYKQMEKYGKINEDFILYLERKNLYILQFNGLIQYEEDIREQLINAIKTLMDLNLMLSSLNKDIINRRKHFNQIMQLINELSEKHDSGAPIDIIKKEMEEKYKVSKEDTERLISKLKDQGNLYEPKWGYFKDVSGSNFDLDDYINSSS